MTDLLTENARLRAALEGREPSLIWIIENTSQVRIRDLALDILSQQRAAIATPAPDAAQEIVAEAVKAEREACARVCETLGALGGVTPNPRAEWKTHADNLAAAIRARGVRDDQ